MTDTPIATGARTPPSLTPWIGQWLVVCAASLFLFGVVLHGRIPVDTDRPLSPQDELRVERLVEALQLLGYDRRVALRAMVDIRFEQSPAIVERLLDLTADDNLSVRQFAMEALGMLNAPRATGRLIAATEDPQPAVVMSAAVALGDVGDAAVREPLVALLDHGDPRVRDAAAQSLAYHALEDRHILALMAHADDPNSRVATAIHATLVRQLDLSPRLPKRSTEEWNAWWQDSGRAGAQTGSS